jgi:hypothetical protein
MDAVLQLAGGTESEMFGTVNSHRPMDCVLQLAVGTESVDVWYFEQ